MWSELRVAVSSAGWPTTQGTVIEHRVMRVGGRFGSTYLATAEFVYEVAGNQYESSQLLCHCLDPQVAQKSVTEYTKGKTIVVLYDPRQPSIAVLESRGLALVTLTKWVLELALIGVFVLVFPITIWALGSNKRLQVTPPSGRL